MGGGGGGQGTGTLQVPKGREAKPGAAQQPGLRGINYREIKSLLSLVPGSEPGCWMWGRVLVGGKGQPRP